ncbi:MAG: (2Fe-2S)-binding protein [Victivallales bacterium]|nr:(2Fe-2S)-binding protein [Victivallales bacterium]
MKLNGENISIESGDTIIDVARRAGVSIPTLCHLRGEKPFASCMVCVVEDIATNKLHPACSTLAQPDMDIKTDTKAVVEQRLCAIEFLLSEHLGDCEGPCRLSCPAYLDVPQIIELAAVGDLRTAESMLRDALAFPRIVSRLCEAPCEKGCRRGRVDASVSIKMIERFVADNAAIETRGTECGSGIDSDSARETREDGGQAHELHCGNSSETHELHSEDSSETLELRSIAIIGGGPAGLACVHHLTQLGFACEIYEKNSECWGGLTTLPESVLPRNLLEDELDALKKAGVIIHTNHLIETDNDGKLRELRDAHSAVIIGTGPLPDAGNGDDRGIFDLKTTEQGVLTDSASFATSMEGVFAVGDVVLPLRKTIQAVADAKLLADGIAKKLLGSDHSRGGETFNSRFGKLFPGDLDEFMKPANENSRTTPTDKKCGFSKQELANKAERCMKCDCAATNDCRLRELADEFGAKQAKRATRRRDERRTFIRIFDKDIIFEPGKCVKCGRCSAICARFAEKNGPAFTKRGYDTEITFPFGIGPSEGLGAAAEECAKACPTGAISLSHGKT